MTVLVAAALCAQAGCVASKYRLAKQNTPPVQRLDVAFSPTASLQSSLTALIIDRGPGSWKREALWDEYVLTVTNPGEQRLTIESASLLDPADTAYAAGTDPWALEKQSRMLEKQYRARGQAFVRSVGPGMLIVGAGAAPIAAGGVFSAGAAAAATAVVIVLPVYYLSVVGINHHNKKAVVAEFTRRRLPLPLALAPGETQTLSVFFPMVRSPRSLTLQWSNDAGHGSCALSLDFLKALHVPAAPSKP